MILHDPVYFEDLQEKVQLIFSEHRTNYGRSPVTLERIWEKIAAYHNQAVLRTALIGPGASTEKTLTYVLWQFSRELAKYGYAIIYPKTIQIVPLVTDHK